MTTLQETARDALEALERIGKDFVCRSAHHAKKDQHSAFAECPVVVRHTDAIESLRTALAQQGEQQPVCHGCGIPAGDVHMSTCKSGKWPSRVSNGDTAAPAPAPAPQPAQGEPTGCACRWDADDNRVATCARHQGWLDVVHEWAERAKAAEAALQSAQPKQEPLRALTDEEILSLEKQIPVMNHAGAEWIYFARAVLKKARE